MPKNYCLKCYLTRPQYEQIKQDALDQGHDSISDYVRRILIGTGFFLEKKIGENNKMLKQITLDVAQIKQKIMIIDNTHSKNQASGKDNSGLY